MCITMHRYNTNSSVQFSLISYARSNEHTTRELENSFVGNVNGTILKCLPVNENKNSMVFAIVYPVVTGKKNMTVSNVSNHERFPIFAWFRRRTFLVYGQYSSSVPSHTEAIVLTYEMLYEIHHYFLNIFCKI